MSGKVVHLSSEIHEKMTEFCRANQLKASDWVSRLIIVVTGGDVRIESVPDKPKPQPLIEVVERKRVSIPSELEAPPADDLWSRAPFWDKRGNGT